MTNPVKVADRPGYYDVCSPYNAKAGALYLALHFDFTLYYTMRLHAPMQLLQRALDHLTL